MDGRARGDWGVDADADAGAGADWDADADAAMSGPVAEALAALELRDGETLAVARKTSGAWSERIVSSAAAALSFVSGADDAYVCANPLRPGATRARDVDVLEGRWLLVDCDPTGTDRGPAVGAARAAYDLVGGAAVLVDSGRGAQCWVRLAPGVDRRGLLSWIRRAVQRPGVRVDATHDPSRYVRLPGTANSRTGRIALILALPTRGPWEHHESLDVGDTAPPADFDDAPPSTEDLAWIAGGVKVVWDAAPGADRSARDYQLVRELLRAGAPEDAACRLLYAMPGSKARTDARDASYWQSTVDSVRRAGTEASEREVALAAALASDDAGALFAPTILAAAASVQREGPVEWQRLRARVKSAAKRLGVTLSDWVEAVSAAGAETLGPPDDVARLVVADGREAYWLLAAADGQWVRSPWPSVTQALRAAGASGDAARAHPWGMAARPFAPAWDARERAHNVSRAQWRVVPSPGPWSAWEQLLRVVGRGLTADVVRDAWCAGAGIATGGDYLLTWLAGLAQRPTEPSAYLFCYGEENIGKSMLHEALSLHLLAGGVVDASRALKSERFNAELIGAVLCWVEEVDFARARAVVRERLKVYVTSPALAIERKGVDVAMVQNCTHWYQSANVPSACPVWEGDTRITAWEAVACEESERAHKDELHRRLAAEAPAFLAALLSLALPPTGGDGRLVVPAVSTNAKAWQASATRDALAVWVVEHPEWVGLSDEALLRAVRAHLDAAREDSRYWTRSRILRSLPGDAESLRLRHAARILRARGVGCMSSATLAQVLDVPDASAATGLCRSLIARGVGWLTVIRGQRRSRWIVSVTPPP
jgi:hypothetical protein